MLEMHEKHPGAVLNLHTGNLIAASDPNSEWVYQIGLSALEMLKVDVIVVVFHGTAEESSVLSQKFPLIDVLIVADNQERDRTGIHSPGIFTGQTAIVSNVSPCAAVGVLEVVNVRTGFSRPYDGFLD